MCDDLTTLPIIGEQIFLAALIKNAHKSQLQRDFQIQNFYLKVNDNEIYSKLHILLFHNFFETCHLT